MTTTQPPDLATNRQRTPITIYSFAPVAPLAVVIAVADQWQNVTANLMPATLTKEIGFFRPDPQVAGDEKIVSFFDGTILVEATVRLTGGTATQSSYFGLFANGDFVTAPPVLLAAIPLDQRDEVPQELPVGSSEVMRIRWLYENGQGFDAKTNTAGTHFQLALASSVADTVEIVNMTMAIEHLIGANNFA